MISVFDTSLFPRSQISRFLVYDNGTLGSSHAAQLLGEAPLTFHSQYSHRIMKNPDSARYKGLRNRTVKWLITFDNFLVILRKRGFSSQALANIHLLLITAAAEAKKGTIASLRFEKLKVAKKVDGPIGPVRPVVTKLVPFSQASRAHVAQAHVVDDDDAQNLKNVDGADGVQGSEVIVNVELTSDRNHDEHPEYSKDDDDDDAWSPSHAAVPAKKRSSEYSMVAAKKRPRVLSSSFSSHQQVVATLDQVMHRVDETISHRLSAFKAEMLKLTNPTLTSASANAPDANQGSQLLEELILRIRAQERERVYAEMDSFFRSLLSRP